MDAFVVRHARPSADRRRSRAAAIDADADPVRHRGVVCTSGTTNAGIIDDLAGVGAVAARARLVVPRRRRLRRIGHLRAARVRAKYAGIERADSFIVDPHKWLFTPFDCCALALPRTRPGSCGPHPGRVVPRRHPRPTDGEWNPTDYAYHLTRRARGLPLWFSLAVHGVDAYREAIEAALALARETADADQAHAAPRADPRARPRRRPVPPHRLEGATTTTAWADGLHRDEVAFVPPSKWEGGAVGRFAFLHPHTTMDLVREVLARTG